MHYSQSKFIIEYLGTKLSIRAEELISLMPGILKIIKGEELSFDVLPPLQKQGWSPGFGNVDLSGNNVPDDVVAVIPIHGAMSRFGSWWNYGTEDYAALLDEAYADERVKSVIIDFHTPGGSTESVIPLKAAIQRKNKPVFGLINSKGFSAGYYAASFTDKIIATDDFAEVGSIGVMATILDDRKMYNDFGLNVVEIIPPESKWKGKAFREARDGKPELLIKEELSPWAVHFQDTIKANRKKLNLDVEGIIEGKTFYAKDAKEYGLIDEIMTAAQAFDYAMSYETRKTIYSILN